MAVLTRRRCRSEKHLVDVAAEELERRPTFPAREAEARRPVLSAARRHDYIELKSMLAGARPPEGGHYDVGPTTKEHALRTQT